MICVRMSENVSMDTPLGNGGHMFLTKSLHLGSNKRLGKTQTNIFFARRKIRLEENPLRKQEQRSTYTRGRKRRRLLKYCLRS